jgi:hypothetical protein
MNGLSTGRSSSYVNEGADPVNALLYVFRVYDPDFDRIVRAYAGASPASLALPARYGLAVDQRSLPEDAGLDACSASGAGAGIHHLNSLEPDHDVADVSRCKMQAARQTAA